jgi:hypothetical protein
MQSLGITADEAVLVAREHVPAGTTEDHFGDAHMVESDGTVWVVTLLRKDRSSTGDDMEFRISAATGEVLKVTRV